MWTGAAGLSAQGDPVETRDKTAAAQILSSWTGKRWILVKRGEGGVRVYICSKVGGKCAITSVEAVLVVGIPANVMGSLSKVVAGAELMCAADPDLSLMSVCAFCCTSSELFNPSACNVIAIRRKLLLELEDEAT